MMSATMPGTTELQPDFDGKRPRKSVMRKTVDYNSAFQLMIESRVFQRRDIRGDRPSLQPDVMYYPELQPVKDTIE
jgi:polyadenylation factor subunit 2